MQGPATTVLAAEPRWPEGPARGHRRPDWDSEAEAGTLSSQTHEGLSGNHSFSQKEEKLANAPEKEA